MTKTPEEAHEDLAYVREAIEHQRRFVGEYLPPWLAALTALYLLVAVGSRYYLEDATGDMVGIVSTVAIGVLFVTIGIYRRRKKEARCSSAQLSSGARRRMVMPMLGMMAALLVLFAARSELGLVGDQFRVAGLLIVGMTMLGVGIGGTATALGMGTAMVLGALAIVYGQYMLLGAFLAGGVLIGSWFDYKRARALDA